MKSKEILKQNKDELARMLTEKRVKIKDMRFKASSGGIKNVKEFRENKKDIARILTVLKKDN
ncbi:MAG: 50S ribosomal protein L29 [Candidatus Pacebacteria bacterium]|nr:50S ribosomal protein L29 [Candidatus Paceibacterota bacterium]